MFLGLPDLDPFVRGIDPDPEGKIKKEFLMKTAF
jgi:hypothetical protein